MFVFDEVIWLIVQILQLYFYVVIASVILSWLVAFEIVNMRNRFVYSIGHFLNRLTEPVLRPIRRIMPNLGGIDLSPLVLVFGIFFVQRLLLRLAQNF